DIGLSLGVAGHGCYQCPPAGRDCQLLSAATSPQRPPQPAAVTPSLPPTFRSFTVPDGPTRNQSSPPAPVSTSAPPSPPTVRASSLTAPFRPPAAVPIRCLIRVT